MFSSFVNTVVATTVNAVNNGIVVWNEIGAPRLPLIELFGPELRWMLRDVISYSGNYDDMYYESHGVGGDRGYNQVWSPERWLLLYWGGGRSSNIDAIARNETE